MQLVIAILAVVLGLLITFGGWRFFLLLLPFWGFLVGFNIGTEATRALFGDGTFSTLTSWIVGFVLALLFAVLSYLYYYAAIALLAGYVGYMLGAAVWGIIGNEYGVIAFIIGIVVGVVFAIGAIALQVPEDAGDRAHRPGRRGCDRGGLVHPHRPGAVGRHHVVARSAP